MEFGALVIQICRDLCFYSRNVQKFGSGETGQYWSSWYFVGWLPGIFRGTGNEGCDCRSSLLSCMRFRQDSEATGNHLEGNWSDWPQRWNGKIGSCGQSKTATHFSFHNVRLLQNFVCGWLQYRESSAQECRRCGCWGCALTSVCILCSVEIWQKLRLRQWLNLVWVLQWIR